MPTSSAVTAGDIATATQYNNLRTDVITTHFHDGTDGYDLFRFARKSSNQDVDGTTLTNDTNLLFTVVNGETWHFSCHLLVTTTATADFKFTFTIPATTANSGVTTSRRTGDATTVNTVVASLDTTNVIALNETTIQIDVVGFIIPSANGTVQLQWAQNTDDGANLTTVNAGSWIQATRVA